jgi:hypothetical protein
MHIRRLAAFLAGLSLCWAPHAAASPLTLSSAYRDVRASIEYTQGTIHKLQTADLGRFDGYMYVDNRPSYVRADLWAHHVSDLTVSADALQLAATFDTHVYWYWPANQFFSFEVILDFSIDSPMVYEHSLTAGCSNWLGGCRLYHPWPVIDGDYDAPSSGTLAPGEHRLWLWMTEHMPWYGDNSARYAFSLRAAPQPVPEPGSLPLVLAAAVALAVARRAKSQQAA